MRYNRNAQSVLEYCILIIIVMAAFLTMQNYIKRGFQGRWKSSVDEVGDQFDPRSVNSAIRHTLITNSMTDVAIVPVGTGYYTLRTDVSLTNETKTGSTQVGNP